MYMRSTSVPRSAKERARITRRRLAMADTNQDDRIYSKYPVFFLMRQKQNSVIP